LSGRGGFEGRILEVYLTIQSVKLPLFQSEVMQSQNSMHLVHFQKKLAKIRAYFRLVSGGFQAILRIIGLRHHNPHLE
jgi:hypothetical protein